MDALSEIDDRLERYPPDRYPVQHATAQFHRGSLLADGGRAEEAVSALATSTELFARAGMDVERAKALNGLGAAHRLLGENDAAAAAFGEAAAVFRTAELAAEEGAALHNLGLVTKEIPPLERARALFRSAGELRAEAAAARELGALLLERGRVKDAVDALRDAVDLSRRSGEPASLGGAANALGLALLAADRPAEAVDALRAAAGAHPPTVRAAEHAMAKANLALAYERAGQMPRARLAAKQAAATPAASPPVRAQAEALLARLGPGVGDAATVAAAEPDELRVAILRDELARWAGAAHAERLHEAQAWIAAAPDELAEPLLGALLELPPDDMQRIAAAFVACADERFRNAFARASVRFPTPQLARLEQAFAWS